MTLKAKILGLSVLVVLVSTAMTGLLAYICIETSAIEQIIQDLSGITVASFIIATTVLIVLIYRLLYQIVIQPIKQLQTLANKISEGEEICDVNTIEASELITVGESLVKMQQSLKAKDHEVKKLAYLDSLTGLPNKATLVNSLNQMIDRAKNKHDTKIGVLFLNLDNFKTINDSLGHKIGDILLKKAADRLNNCICGQDFFALSRHPKLSTKNLIARLSGDEFMLLLIDLTSAQEASSTALRILATLAEPFLLNGNEVHIKASIGISIYPNDGNNAEVLIKNSDIAMHAAKSKGKNSYQFYDDSMNIHMARRLELESGMRTAIENNEFFLNYQPRVSINDPSKREFEALIRWQHPTRGLIGPMEFIPIAEETGFIQDIGEWILDQACQQIRFWRDNGMPNVLVSINISSIQINYGSPVLSIKNMLSKHDISSRHLEIEITESSLIENEAVAINLLTHLRNLGVAIALDDFGTGYSSLSYLKRFPIDTLKIDRTFIQDIEKDQESLKILKSIINLAHDLKLKIVAEGVETREQLDSLIELNCETIQGFYLAKPMLAERAASYYLNGFTLPVNSEQLPLYKPPTN